MVRIIDQLRQIVFAGIVELETGQAIHGLGRIGWIGLIHLHNFCLSRGQSTFKAPDDDHRNDDILIFVTLVCTAQLVCDRPDEVYLSRHVNGRIVPHCVDHLFISHLLYTPQF